MEERITIMMNKKPKYDIVYHTDFQALPEELAGMEISARRLCIVTDSHVKELYADTLVTLLTPHAKQVDVFAFPAGEASKTLDTVREIYVYLIEHHYDRKDMLLALGGGVVGDITGYAAATYLRGIDFIQIPTTLIAQS
ncbi:MAG: iron-containing alcohol dehydrogenase, partial [Lachnospiraceae bacterium]|nr:iron-containing alcohol dehydrogenase [Lachnospiraceae bacterium]